LPDSGGDRSTERSKTKKPGSPGLFYRQRLVVTRRGEYWSPGRPLGRWSRRR
jgi:hypothetical protein